MLTFDKLTKEEQNQFADLVFGALANFRKKSKQQGNEQGSEQGSEQSSEQGNEQGNEQGSEREFDPERPFDENDQQNMQRGHSAERAIKATRTDVMQALSVATPEWKREEHLGRQPGIGNSVRLSDPTRKFLGVQRGSDEWKGYLSLYSGIKPELLSPKNIDMYHQIYEITKRTPPQKLALSEENQMRVKRAEKVVEFDQLRDKLSADLALVDARREGEQGRSNRDTENMEEYFMFFLEQNNWFYDSIDDDPTGQTNLLTTTITTDPDDRFNHIDVACAALGEETGYKPLLFGVDFTSQPDAAALRRKMEYVHLQGRRDDRIAAAHKDPRVGLAGTMITPAGPSPMKSDPDYEKEMHFWRGKRHSDYNLKDFYRQGMKIPGFANLDYVWMNEVENDPRYPKGHQPVTERFVVGASSKVMQSLVSKPPDPGAEEFVGNPKAYEEALTRFRQGHDLSERILKWCTLLECRKQAQDIAEMMRSLSPNELARLKRESPEDFKKAYQDSMRAERYFTAAVEKAKEATGVKEYAEGVMPQDESPFILDNPEQVAYECAMRDEVLQGIFRNSDEIYLRRY